MSEVDESCGQRLIYNQLIDQLEVLFHQLDN